MGHCVLNEGSEKIQVKFRTLLSSLLGFECCANGWHLCGKADFERCYNKEGRGKTKQGDYFVHRILLQTSERTLKYAVETKERQLDLQPTRISAGKIFL